MAEYIELSRQEFEEALSPRPFRVVEDSKCREILYHLETERSEVGIRLFSSVDNRTGVTRGVGEDAVRVVLWNNPDDRPISKGKRIYRVTSKESIRERINKAIELLVGQVKEVEIIDWRYVKAVLVNSSKNNNGFAKSLLDSLEQYGRLTENQLAYVIGRETPKGFPTMEHRLRDRGWKWEPPVDYDDLEDDEPTTNEEPYDPLDKFAWKNGDVEVDENLSVITDAQELVSAEGYPYKFEQFNPVQSAIFPYRDEDTNIVIGANTSSGKTVCAELLMDETLKKGKRVIYLSPLKSLTQEKYADWQKRFPDDKICILTGDYTLSPGKQRELGESRIIVMTSEMTDSRTRKMKAEKNYWLLEVGLVIADETHILSTSRGHAVESGIMRFTSINKNARVLFLSATMPNVDQLGEWLTELNGKSTRVIYSTWRPVELQMHYCEYKIARNQYGSEDYWASQEAKRSLAVEIVKSKPNEKFLVFTHDKRTGRNIVKRLAEVGIPSHFHNADLDLEERLEIEDSFQRRDNGLRVLVSTSTLAWGRNLPARNVVIVGVHRGLQAVDQLDIIQMSGRAGRYGLDDEGHVYLIIPEDTAEGWKEIFKCPRPVTSVLNDHHTLAFHVLAEIQNRGITDAQSMLAWYERSLAYRQGMIFSIEDAEGLMKDLIKLEMIVERTGYCALTGLGRVSAWLYYSPYDVASWYRNLNKLFRNSDKEESVPAVTLDDLTLAWALTDIPSNDWGYVPSDVRNECADFVWQLKNRGVTQVSNAVYFSLAAYACLMGVKEPEGAVRAAIRQIKFDIKRVAQALQLIDRYYARWDREKYLGILSTRIIYGVPEDMVTLVEIPGIGGVKARKMWDVGIRSVEDAATRVDLLKKIFSPREISQVRIRAQKLLREDVKDEDVRTS